jgi:hypothetical protein
MPTWSKRSGRRVGDAGPPSRTLGMMVIARDQKSSRSTRTGAAVSISGSCEQRRERALQPSRAHPLFTMSRSPRRLCRAELGFFLHGCGAPIPRGALTARHFGGKWWSQTGSNRRHPACKAGALPAELWPRTSRVGVRSRSRPSSRRRSPCGKWWAWEDLNFRPHAYQARALTN